MDIDLSYFSARPDEVFDAIVQHLYITIVAVAGASLIGVFLGVLVTRVRALYDPILTIAGIIYTVPSLAMFVLMIPILGIGFGSAVVALILYSLLIVIRNTAVGIDGVDPNIVESAHGMGMTPLDILIRVELPLALPVIFAGVRVATVSAISLATIAAFIGAGGIGSLLFEGLSSQRNDKVIAGALAASLMAIAAQILLQQIERGSSTGVTGSFQTLGEQVMQFFRNLRERPEWIVLIGAALLALAFFNLTWITPYSNDEAIVDNAEVAAAFEEAGFDLNLTGTEIVGLRANAPVQQSLQLLPWLALIVTVAALLNLVNPPGSRAFAEVMLICGILAFFPLVHFTYEVQRAIGELGSRSELLVVIRNGIREIADVSVGLRPETLDIQTGFTVAAVGAALIIVGAFMKSMWFRQAALREQELKLEAMQS